GTLASMPPLAQDPLGGDRDSASSPSQPALSHAPDQEVDAILAEERLALEHHRGHAPVTGRLERALVLRDDPVVTAGITRDRRIELLQVETGACRCLREMRSL